MAGSFSITSVISFIFNIIGFHGALQQRQAVAGENLAAFRLGQVFAVRVAQFLGDDLRALRFVSPSDGDRFTVTEGAEYVEKAAEEGYAYLSAVLA